MPLVLHVDRSWNGDPLTPELRAELTLAIAGEELEVRVDAPFHDDPPPPGPPGPTPALWEHEVVELFVAAAEGGAAEVEYFELELSPHGHHLALRLRGVRRAVEQGLVLDFSTVIDPGRPDGPRWRGTARVPRAWLPPPPHRVAAFAVHGLGSSRRYLSSVALPGDRPDFHQPHRFPRLELPGPETIRGASP